MNIDHGIPGDLWASNDTVCPKTASTSGVFVSHTVQAIILREPAIPAVDAGRKIFFQQSFYECFKFLIEPDFLK
jgi:hypothetical protein